MGKGKATYDFSNVPCNGKRVVVGAKGLEVGAAERGEACCILVTLNQASPRNKHEREFVHWTNKLSVQVRRCEAAAEAVWASREQVKADIEATGSATFECYGSPEALDSLRTLPCVAKWEWMMSGSPSVRVVQQGSGPEKVKPTRPKVKPPVVWGGSPEDNGMTAKENDNTKWEGHKDAMGELVKGVASLPE